jgi:hypothetical protein
MVNTLPMIGRLAVITMGGATIGNAQNVSCSIDAPAVKDYVQGSQLPAILESGNQSFKFSCGKLFIDGTYATQVLGGTKVSIIVYPSGTTVTGNAKFTLGNAVFDKWALKADQKGIVGEDVGGEAAIFTVGTV